MGKWSALLNIGKKTATNVGRSAESAMLHPQRTLAGAGQAVKSATVGAGVGYVGWQALVNDKPVVRTVADVTLGKNTVNAVVETTGNAVDAVKRTIHDVGDSTAAVNGTVQQANSTFGGISKFLKNMSGGRGTDMFGNFFTNLTNGNVSGLSIVGLLAAGMMIFGRFGWLGKIGGALLAMMLIGNHSALTQTRTQIQAKVSSQTEENRTSEGIRR